MNQRQTSSKIDDLLSQAQQQQAEKEKAHWKSVKEEASKCLRWVFEEGDLPWGLGKYRIAIPYFELLGEKTLAFLRVTDSGGKISIANIGNGFIHLNIGGVNASWKGILPLASPLYGREWDQFAFKYGRLHLAGRYYMNPAVREIDIQTMMCDVSWESSEAE
jgi:hypothetical protein